MIEISWGSANDYQEIIKFANEVFDENFPALLPKLYYQNPEISKLHLLLKEDGELLGLLLCSKDNLYINGKKALTIGGIGTVSVSPKARGRGIMATLLERADEEMKAQGYDLTSLGGHRQRYENYGYFPCGMTLSATVEKNNIRHLFNPKNSLGLQIEKLERDSPYLSNVKIMAETSPAYFSRNDERLFDILSSWKAAPHAVLHNDKFVGYVCFAPEDDYIAINEIMLDDYSIIVEVIRLITDSSTVKIKAPLYEKGLCDILFDISQYYSIDTSHSFYILNFPQVIVAYLELKNNISPLTEGYSEFCIEKTPISISVEKGAITVSVLDNPKKDIPTISKAQAHLLLFSTKGYLVSALDELNVPADWFPLPLYCPLTDAV